MTAEAIKQEILQGISEAVPAVKELIGSDNHIVPVVVVVVISGPIAISRERETEVG